MKFFTVFFKCARPHTFLRRNEKNHNGKITFGATSQVNTRSTATEQANINNGQQQRPPQPSGALDQACEKRECAGANLRAGVGHQQSVEIRNPSLPDHRPFWRPKGSHWSRCTNTKTVQNVFAPLCKGSKQKCHAIAKDTETNAMVPCMQGQPLQ